MSGAEVRRSQYSVKQHGERIRFLASRATGDPDSHDVSRFFVRENLRQMEFECLERFGIAEKVGDANQQVLKQSRRFAGMGAQKRQIIRKIGERVDLQTSGDAAQHRRAFIMREIVTGACLQKAQNIAQSGFVDAVRTPVTGLSVGFEDRFSRWRLRGRENQLIFVLDEAHQSRRHFVDAQNPIDHAGLNRGARHAIVFGFFGVLRDGDATMFFDALNANRSVGIETRKHNGHSAPALRRGQRTEKEVDRHALAELVFHGRQTDDAILHHQVLTGRNDINVIRFQLHWLRHALHRHLRVVLKNFGKLTVEIRRQVQNDHESQPRIRRKPGKQALNHPDATRRTADSNDWQRCKSS
jgi:uncharacterized protein (DUF2249 family)